MATTGLVPEGVKIPDLSKINFDDESTKGPDVLRTNIVYICLVVVIVSLRIFARLYAAKRLFIDDVLVIIASLLTIGFSSICIASVGQGLGKHVWNLDLTRIIHIVGIEVKLLMACFVLYSCATAFTKFSIIATYLQIFRTKTSRRIIYAAAVLAALVCIMSVPAIIFQCSPVQAIWDYTIIHRKCISFINILYVSSAVNIAIDVTLVALAVPHLWGLNLPRRQKVILCFLFCIGAMACIASIIRIAQIPAVNEFDLTYEIVTILDWSVNECSLGIICISIAPMRPLFIRLFPSSLITAISQRHTIRHDAETSQHDLRNNSADTAVTAATNEAGRGKYETGADESRAAKRLTIDSTQEEEV